jgi:uncharacterized protein YoxC
MAEVVGVVASSVAIGTLAAQMTSSVAKLKSYWDQVKDAPEDINDLIEQLEFFRQVLTNIETDQQQHLALVVIMDRMSLSNCLESGGPPQSFD